MRHVDDTLGDLKALSVEANAAAVASVTGDVVPTYQFFIQETELPGGALQVAPPVGIWSNARYKIGHRESGSVGSPIGEPNIYWLLLLDSIYKPSDERVAQGQAQMGLVNAFMDLAVLPDGQPCFDGLVAIVVGLERPPFIKWGDQTYRGSHLVVWLDERYN